MNENEGKKLEKKQPSFLKKVSKKLFSTAGGAFNLLFISSYISAIYG